LLAKGEGETSVNWKCPTDITTPKYLVYGAKVRKRQEAQETVRS